MGEARTYRESMGWRIEGEYFMGCTCTAQVHWPIDGSMNDRNGACDSVSVFRITTGTYADEDLTGLKFAVLNFFPARLSTGTWHMGMVVDPDANDAQTTALEYIMRGIEGGPMSAVARMIGDYMGSDQGSIGYLEGERLFGAVEGRGSFTFTPTLEDGKPILAPSAMYVFAEHYKVGRSAGRVTAFGRSFTTDYGEYGTFSFSDANTGMEREFRPSRITGVYGTGSFDNR
jgi:hypothetical protein